MHSPSASPTYSATYSARDEAIPAFCAAFALGLATLALVGWLVGYDWLASWGRGWTTQKFNTALATVGLAIALLAAIRRTWIVASAGVILAVAIAASALFQRATGLDLGIDQLVVADPLSASLGQAPGRMAAGTAVSIALVGAALVAARTPHVRLSQGLALSALLISWVAIIGYGHEFGPIPVEWLYGSVSLPTAVCVGALAIGTAWLHPARGFVRFVTADDPGAQILRRLGPVALALPGVTTVLGNWLEYLLDWSPGYAAVLGAAFNAVIFAVVLAATAAETRRADDARKEVARRLIDVQETERRSLAHELHDELGQTLTALGLLIERAARKPEALATARELVTTLTTGVRTLALELRPSMLDDLGLVPALRWLVGRQIEIDVVLRVVGESARFPTAVETAAYRIVQEALTNAARHSGAAHATVTLRIAPSSLVLTIEDDGHGFDPAVHGRSGLGLAGMRDRVRLLAGDWTLESGAKGTSIRVTLPLAREVPA